MQAGSGRLWTYVRDDRPSGDPTAPAVWFAYSPDRKGENPRQHLKLYKGALQADAYAGFQQLYEAGTIFEVACWAHTRRKFYEIHVAHASPVSTEAIERIAALYAIEAEIRGSTPEIRRAIRQARARPLLDGLHTWLEKTLAKLSRKSDTAAAIRYAMSRWPALTRYADDGQLEIDNNTAERALRVVALGRKNYLFCGSDAGGARRLRLPQQGGKSGIIPQAVQHGIDCEPVRPEATCIHPAPQPGERPVVVAEAKITLADLERNASELRLKIQKSDPRSLVILPSTSLIGYAQCHQFRFREPPSQKQQVGALRFIQSPKPFIGPGPPVFDQPRVVRLHLACAIQIQESLLIMTSEIQNRAEMPIHGKGKWIQPERPAHLRDRIFWSAHRIEIDGVLQFCQRIVWSQRDTLFQVPPSRRPISAIDALDEPQSRVGLSALGMERDRASRCGKSLRLCVGREVDAQHSFARQCFRQSRIRSRIGGIERDRLWEVRCAF